MGHQLTLDITLRTKNTFENFYVGTNEMVYGVLQKFYEGKRERFIYLWGEEGAGKSHLLQACCHLFNQHGQRVAYLPLAERQGLSPAVLEGLEHLSLLCIDDIDTICGASEWEEALFHCYNRLLLSGCQLLMSANVPPSQLPLLLPDLKSRLGQGVIFQVHSLNDEQKVEVLQRHAVERGFNLPSEVANYLLTHYGRGTKQLFALLDRLEQVSLETQHRLTLPFVKQHCQDV